VREAERRTGLADFGDDDAWREGLARFCAALEAEAALTPLGRSIARGSLIDALANRLQMTDWRRRHPEIDAERIERPLVVIGMGRTGTTILHDLLARDPANRVPLSWEVDTPCPPPERASFANDPRIAATDARLARTDQLVPGFKTMHPMGALLPQECVSMLSTELASIAFQLLYRVPSYTHWLHEEADLAPAYRGHRRWLQLLQWRCPGRWVLKSPCHLWHLRALLATYPDALLVQTHRDPLQVLSSLTSLATTIRKMASDAIDPAAIAREWSHWNAVAYERSVRARVEGWIAPERVFDLHFSDFLKDPLRSIEQIYAFAGLSWTPAVADAMRAWWQAHPADAHGRHVHRFSDTGLDERSEREKVKGYVEFFGVQEELVS
jgi:Sulfotransferase family